MMEGMLIGQGKADENPIEQKQEEPEEYEVVEEAVGGVSLDKQQQSKLAESIGKYELNKTEKSTHRQHKRVPL